MTKYVALLRGINVGGNNKISMRELRVTFESLGFVDVTTYINSGNVIFSDRAQDAGKLAKKIEREIKKDFALEIKVLVRDAKNIKELCKKIPSEWTNDSEQRTDVLFLWNAFDAKSTIGLIAINPDVDTLKYISGAIVWNFNRNNYSKSGMHKIIGTEVYKNQTARNVNTVRKLNELMK